MIWEIFSLQIIRKEKIEKEILSLNDTKASQKSNILMTIIKMNVDMFREILHSEFNKAIELSQFPPCMKTVDVIPVYKKCSLLVKCN